jgi:hypothetical protein
MVFVRAPVRPELAHFRVARSAAAQQLAGDLRMWFSKWSSYLAWPIARVLEALR